MSLPSAMAPLLRASALLRVLFCAPRLASHSCTGSGPCSLSIRREPIANVKQSPIVAKIKKYDFARSMASELFSSVTMSRLKMSVASRD
jgi:hypothetical protein